MGVNSTLVSSGPTKGIGLVILGVIAKSGDGSVDVSSDSNGPGIGKLLDGSTGVGSIDTITWVGFIETSGVSPAGGTMNIFGVCVVSLKVS